ncbi:MAG: SGNH/GDSL hydrolase family protein [Gemmatimonadaceae bacterium]
MLRINTLTRVAAFGAAVALAACTDNPKLLGPATPVGGDMFKSYVAIGNSITAGYQSGGINDSTQRQSFARLLAGQMGTQYHYASLNMPGCSAPVANFQTQARVLTGAPKGTTQATLQPCYLRASASVTDILNNVAVPGARVLDPISATTVASNALTTFVLGGKTQVERALDASPTFVTIWIGNNDVLEAGASGILVPTAGISPGIVSTQAQFQASYDAMIQQLVDSEPNLKGVLIGVVQVAGIPLMQSGALIASSTQIQQGINQAAGQPVTIHPNCTGSASLVSVPELIPLIRAGTHPPLISCEPGVIPGTVVGDLFVLDATEQATLAAAITGYNDYIKSKADAIGFGYYDPNVLLAVKKATGEIPPFPDFTSTDKTFGTFISLDGIHPAAATHKLIANDLIGVINAKYGTSLQPVP